jgi:hypothetical protein
MLSTIVYESEDTMSAEEIRYQDFCQAAVKVPPEAVLAVVQGSLWETPAILAFIAAATAHPYRDDETIRPDDPTVKDLGTAMAEIIRGAVSDLANLRMAVTR